MLEDPDIPTERAKEVISYLLATRPESIRMMLSVFHFQALLSCRLDIASWIRKQPQFGVGWTLSAVGDIK